MVNVKEQLVKTDIEILERLLQLGFTYTPAETSAMQVLIDLVATFSIDSPFTKRLLTYADYQFTHKDKTYKMSVVYWVIGDNFNIKLNCFGSGDHINNSVDNTYSLYFPANGKSNETTILDALSRWNKYAIGAVKRMEASDERFKQLKIENQTRDQNKEQINREVSQRVLAKHGLLDHPKAADICETVL